jgi:hypothetical protein
MIGFLEQDTDSGQVDNDLLKSSFMNTKEALGNDALEYVDCYNSSKLGGIPVPRQVLRTYCEDAAELGIWIFITRISPKNPSTNFTYLLLFV